ncbi:UNVERIFIED_CONTAM: hypothetical protein PYX00_007453 [Menopon gallinae]|uniref:Uncharacterized protein n=1 Tax=Menopon gallinae TaxID=328185 RepID=A0AAW2HK68_9NEOP
MIIGSASRYIGGRQAVQTVYWRVSNKNEKLVKTGKNFNLTKPTVDESANMRTRYAGSISSYNSCAKTSFI